MSQSSSRLVTLLKAVLPVIIIGIGIGVTVWLIRTREEVVTVKQPRHVPTVRVATVRPREFQFQIETEGTVRPRVESTLIPEVTGVIVEVAPSWASGGFFARGDILLRIDPRDYELALVRAESDVKRAEVALEREKGEASVARAEWEKQGSNSRTPSPLVLREPQLAEARAQLAAATAAREQARIDLERTVLKAPYAGRIRSKSVDLAQHVSRGTPVAVIYSIEAAEIRLPIPDSELAFVDLPLGSDMNDSRNLADGAEGDKSGSIAGPKVVLTALFAGREFSWTGRIARTEGEIDPQSRMVHAVAEVMNPYANGSDPSRPPLAVGLFVRARIQGRRAADVFVLPRTALRQGGKVLVVDTQSRLHLRQVEVERIQGETAIVSSGLEAGERICLSPLEVVVDGKTTVRVDAASSQPEVVSEPPQPPTTHSE